MVYIYKENKIPYKMYYCCKSEITITSSLNNINNNYPHYSTYTIKALVRLGYNVNNYYKLDSIENI